MSLPRSANALDHKDFQIGERLAGVTMLELISAVQGYHELLTGVPAPGASTLLFMPHDHYGDRGIAWPRGTQSFAAFGANSTAMQWTTTGNDWFIPDFNGGQIKSFDVTTNERDIQDPNGFEVPPAITAYCTPGIDTDYTAVSTNPCYYDVKLLAFSSFTSAELRFYNRTTQSTGTAVSVGGTATDLAEVTIKCPMKEGVINEIDLEQRCTAGANTMRILQWCFAETRSTSQPATSGTVAYASSTRP